MSQLQVRVSARQPVTLEVDFSVGAGVTALFGPSGAGKSSLALILAGLRRAQQARISINGRCLVDSEQGLNLPARQRRIGLVFQDGRLFPHLSVAANLRYGMPRGASGFHAAVQLLGLEALLQRRPAQLSGGEQRRVAIGRALLMQPALLILDEPLSGLDQARRADVLGYLARLRSELALPMLYISHAVDEVARLADHLVLMEAGRSVACGPAASLLASLQLPELSQDGAAGAIISGVLHQHDARWGLSTVAFEGGQLLVPAVARPLGSSLRLRVAARDVALALAPPPDCSMLNCLPAQVLEVGKAHGPYVEVALAVGATRLLARVTARSAHELCLAPGLSVQAMIKSVALDASG